MEEYTNTINDLNEKLSHRNDIINILNAENEQLKSKTNNNINSNNNNNNANININKNNNNAFKYDKIHIRNETPGGYQIPYDALATPTTPSLHGSYSSIYIVLILILILFYVKHKIYNNK